MDIAKVATGIITVLGLSFIVSMCNNVTSHSDSKQSTTNSISSEAEKVALAAEQAALEADTVANHSDNEKVESNSSKQDSSSAQEEIPFKLHSQAEYDQEVNHILQLVVNKLSNIYEQDADTKYRVMCLELPMIAYSLQAFSQANPEYSNPQVNFADVMHSINNVQADLMVSCN